MSINYTNLYLSSEDSLLPDIEILNKEIDKYWSDLPEIEVLNEEII